MKIAIIDDLDADRERTCSMIQQYFTSVCTGAEEDISTFKNGEEFLTTFERGGYDLIFVDYFMEALSGLEMAKEVRKTDDSVAIIFTTVSREFAIDCYKVKAGGYLVKPFTYDDLTDTMAVINLRQIREKQFICLNSSTHSVRILLKDIVYCDVTGHYIQIHMHNGENFRSRMAFSEIAGMLEPHPEFLLCFRGCIVNMRQVARIEDLNFLMSNQERVPFRKKEQSKILRAYSDFVFKQVREDI